MELNLTSDSENEDNEFLKFSKRICSTPYFQVKLKCNIISDSESDDDEFLELSERIRNTPYSQVKFNPNVTSNNKSKVPESVKYSEKFYTPHANIKLDFSTTSDSENDESELLNSPEKFRTPQVNIKLNFSGTSSDSENESEFLNVPEKVESTSHSQFIKDYQEDTSDSDEAFSNLVERISKASVTSSQSNNNYLKTSELGSKEACADVAMRLDTFHTPMTVNNENHHVADESDSDDVFSNLADRVHKFCTPLTQIRTNHHKGNESESDDSFSNFVQKLCTPMSECRRNNHKINEAESDESFSNFVQKLHTPMSANRKSNHNADETEDSDDSFLKPEALQAFRAPISQRRVGRRDSMWLPEIPENQGKCLSAAECPKQDGVLSPEKTAQEKNEKEFNELFPPDTIDSTFLQCRTVYTHTLFEFFNKKIFASKLPEDMPIVWAPALISTAGLTCCSREKGVYSCYIKLSPELLVTFDRLKSTLLHEMCHAAVWVINKQTRVRHGPLWQVWAARCKLILPFVECPIRCHNYEIAYRVFYHCTKCNWTKGKCKQVRKYHGAVCKKCKTPITMTYA